jgi:hypothetical protein
MYDRVIVQDVIKSIAQTQQIDTNAKHQFKGSLFPKTQKDQPTDIYDFF